LKIQGDDRYNQTKDIVVGALEEELLCRQKKRKMEKLKKDLHKR